MNRVICGIENGDSVNWGTHLSSDKFNRESPDRLGKEKRWAEGATPTLLRTMSGHGRMPRWFESFQDQSHKQLYELGPCWPVTFAMIAQLAVCNHPGCTKEGILTPMYTN